MVNTVNLATNGISTFIINSAKIMAKKGINITILAPNKVNKNLKNELLIHHINLKEIIGRKYNPFRYFFQLKSYLSRQQFDVIHVNGNSTTMSIELLASKLAGIRLRIAHSHNTTTEHPLINKALRPLFDFCVNGRLACNKAAGKWLFKSEKFTIIPNGIDLLLYYFSFQTRNSFRNKLNIRKNEILIGNVGTFNYQKNQIFLIKLIEILPSNYKLILIGKGENYSKIRKEINEYKLEDRVILTGIVNDVKDYLNAMDLFLLPSHFEGQPFVLVEAAASGLKCIVSDKVSKETNLTKDVVFLSLFSLKIWRKKVLELATKESDRKKKSRKNIKVLSSKGYSVQQNINKLIKYYNA